MIIILLDLPMKILFPKVVFWHIAEIYTSDLNGIKYFSNKLSLFLQEKMQ